MVFFELLAAAFLAEELFRTVGVDGSTYNFADGNTYNSFCRCEPDPNTVDEGEFRV